MTSFGYTEMGIGTPTTDDLDRMRAAIATAPQNGNVASLSAWIKAWSGSGGTTIDAKCAIYKVSDDSLVGYTDERECVLTESFQLFEFTCSTPIAVVASTDYYLTLFKDFNGVITETAATNVGDSSDYYQNQAYGAFPATCSFSTYVSRITIYATYTSGMQLFTLINEMNY
jgi:hypothetical protein